VRWLPDATDAACKRTPCPQTRSRNHAISIVATVRGRRRRGVSVAHVQGDRKERVTSRAGVGMVVEELLSDEELRVRFALDPLDTVAALFCGASILPVTRSISCA
jgi:hypothetical protein